MKCTKDIVIQKNEESVLPDYERQQLLKKQRIIEENIK